MLIEQRLMLLIRDKVNLDSNRFHFNAAPPTTTKPYIVLKKISSPRDHTHQGASGHAVSRFQVSIFANSYFQGKQIAKEVQQIQGLRGDEITAVFYVNEVDLYILENNVHSLNLDFLIHHNE